jgi:hypothetical protein
MIIDTLPVCCRYLHYPAQKMGCQKANLYPGQYEKTGVIGYQMQILLPNFFTPTNKPVPAPNMTRG